MHHLRCNQVPQVLNFKYWHYDYLQFSKLNQHEFVAEIMYKDYKFSYMYNPNYLGMGTRYDYIYLSKLWKLDAESSVEGHIATGLVERPELVDVRTYQEAKVTYNKDIKPVKVFASFSGTNRKKYYTDDKYHDSSLFFGVKLPF